MSTQDDIVPLAEHIFYYYNSETAVRPSIHRVCFTNVIEHFDFVRALPSPYQAENVIFVITPATALSYFTQVETIMCNINLYSFSRAVVHFNLRLTLP